MHILVGLFLLALGLVFALFAPRLATTGGTRSAKRTFTASNVAAFRLIGALIAVAGLLYAVGVIG
ncbi:hypothetical protein AB0M57_26980 [Streptomyces sp. NPDC051597]|uniref:hypothetical protein n=1 Tax=Streptomyces sp. NPDC051597 TaxID=3155049 RepID=UPI00341CA50E